MSVIRLLRDSETERGPKSRPTDSIAHRDFLPILRKGHEHCPPTELLHCAAKLEKRNDALLIEIAGSLDHIRCCAAPVLVALSDGSCALLAFDEDTHLAGKPTST